MKATSTSPQSVCVLLSLAFLFTAFVGCGSKLSPAEQMIADQNKTNLQRVCNMYSLYLAKNGWKGPADEATFKKFIKGLEERVISRMGIEPGSIDDIFVGDDGEAFEIKYGIAASERGEPVAIVFEKTGSDGQRWVGFSRPPHKQVDDSEYKKLKGN